MNSFRSSLLLRRPLKVRILVYPISESSKSSVRYKGTLIGSRVTIVIIGGSPSVVSIVPNEDRVSIGNVSNNEDTSSKLITNK